MHELLRLARAIRCDVADPAQAFSHRLRIGLLIAALILILVVLFQSGKSQGLSGAIGGIADSYMSRSKARSVDAKLAKATKWVGAIFVILTLVLNCMVAAGL